MNAPVPMEDCGMCAATEILSDRWTLLIIREAFYGVFRFEDILADIKIPRAVLSDRLKKLVNNKVLLKESYHEEGSRRRMGYRLSKKGVALAPVFIAMMDWGDTYCRKNESAIQVFDKKSNSNVNLRFVPETAQGKTIDTDQLSFVVKPKA